MKYVHQIWIFTIVLFLSGGWISDMEMIAQNPDKKYVMVIHGGAGTMKKENMSPEQEKEYKNMLRKALSTGYDILKKGEPAADAVVRSEEHTSELQSRGHLVCRLLLEKKKE